MAGRRDLRFNHRLRCRFVQFHSVAHFLNERFLLFQFCFESRLRTNLAQSHVRLFVTTQSPYKFSVHFRFHTNHVGVAAGSAGVVSMHAVVVRRVRAQSSDASTGDIANVQIFGTHLRSS